MSGNHFVLFPDPIATYLDELSDQLDFAIKLNKTKMKKIKSATLLKGWQYSANDGKKFYRTFSDYPLKSCCGSWRSDVIGIHNFRWSEEQILKNLDFFKVEYEPEEPRFEFHQHCSGFFAEATDSINKTEFNRFINWCRTQAGELKETTYLWYVGYDTLNKGLYYNNCSQGIIISGAKFYGVDTVELFIRELSRPENQSWYYWYIRQLEKADL